MNYAKLIISSRLENISLVASCAKGIAGRSFRDEVLSEIELSVSELITNCIEHAYENSNDKEISIEFKRFETHLIINVSDEGKALDPQILKNINGIFDFDPEDFDNLPEGGFGLNIMKASMDEVTYERLSTRNQWTLTKFC